MTISRQIYALFKPVYDKGFDGLPLSSLMDSVYDTSLDFFATDLTSTPCSLSKVLREALINRELEILSGTHIRMTPRGEKSFWYIFNTDISALDKPNKQEIEAGRNISQCYKARIMGLAMGGLVK